MIPPLKSTIASTMSHPTWLDSRSRPPVSIDPLMWLDAEWIECNRARVAPRWPDLLSALVDSMPPRPTAATATSLRMVDFMSLQSGVETQLRRLCRMADLHTYTVPAKKAHFDANATGRVHECTIDRPTTLEDESIDILCSLIGMQSFIRSSSSSSSPSFVSSALRSLLSTVHSALRPGSGHIFLAESVSSASVSLIDTMTIMQSIGFVDIDVAFAQDGVWLIAARKTSDNTRTPAPNNETDKPTIKYTPLPLASPPPSTPSAASATPGAASSSLTAASVLVDRGSPSPPPHRSLPRESPSPPPPAASAAHPPVPATASESGPLPAHLLAKMPLLFARFDPSRTGLLTYKALQSLRRAVGDARDEDEDDLWWTYQSIAEPDKETGVVGISIEDLTEHFYKTRIWNLQHDLEKLRII